MIIGWLFLVAGIVVFIDALDNAIYFPLNFFAALFVLEGLATLAIAKSGVGGQRVLRYAKGIIVLAAGILVLAGHHHGHFVLSMIFGLLFLVDGLMQCTAAYVVRYERWRYVFASGVAEILLAIFFFQPYPTHYVARCRTAWGCSWRSPASSCWRWPTGCAAWLRTRRWTTTRIRISCPRAPTPRPRRCSTARRKHPSAR